MVTLLWEDNFHGEFFVILSDFINKISSLKLLNFFVLHGFEYILCDDSAFQNEISRINQVTLSSVHFTHYYFFLHCMVKPVKLTTLSSHYLYTVVTVDCRETGVDVMCFDFRIFCGKLNYSLYLIFWGLMHNVSHTYLTFAKRSHSTVETWNFHGKVG